MNQLSRQVFQLNLVNMDEQCNSGNERCCCDSVSIKHTPCNIKDIQLISAARHGKLDDVKCLLDPSPANIEASTANYGTSLHMAVYYGHKEIVEVLLNNQPPANIESINKDSWTPLHIAAQRGYLDIVKLLLDKRVNINVTTKFKRTPLHLAACDGHQEIIKLLLDYGTDKSLLDKNNNIAADINPRLKEFIESHVRPDWSVQNHLWRTNQVQKEQILELLTIRDNDERYYPIPNEMMIELFKWVVAI